MQSLPLMTLENVRSESSALNKLQGSAFLKRLLEVRLPVTLSPIVRYADINNENMLEKCSFTLIAVPKKQTNDEAQKMELSEEIADLKKEVNVNIPNNVDDGNSNNIASKYDFLFSVGNGKFLKMVNNAYLGRIGIDGGEMNCQSNWYKEDAQGNPEPGFLFTLLPQSVENEATKNSFIIRSLLNGKYLGPDAEDWILCADYATIEEATKFTFDMAL